MTTPSDIEHMLQQIADITYAEPDIVKRLQMAAAFRKATMRLRQEVFAAAAYEAKMQEVRVIDMALILKSQTGTVSRAISQYCKERGLPRPYNFRFNPDVEDIVTLPSPKGEN